MSKGCAVVRLVVGFLMAGMAGDAAWAQELPDEGLLFVPPSEQALVGQRLPDVALVCADGTTTTLSELNRDRPLFLTLVFTRCAGICSPYLGLLKKTVSRVGGSGQRYQMVVVSFDLADTPAAMQALAEHHGLENDRGWTFAVPKTEADRDALCRALHFDFRWDETRRQYNHPAITVAVRDREIIRLSVGEEISPARFKEMLSEARGEYVPIYPEPGARATLFRCFDYDPARGFTPNWGMLILAGPALAGMIVVIALFWVAGLAGRPHRSRRDGQVSSDAKTEQVERESATLTD